MVRVAITPFHNDEQPDDANRIQDKDHQRVGAQVKELAFGVEDEAADIDGCQQHTQAGKVDISVFGLWEDRLSGKERGWQKEDG